MATPTVPSQTKPVVCFLLVKGQRYYISTRPEIGEVATTILLSVYGTGMRYAPPIVLTNGESRKVMIKTFTAVTSTRLEFEGSIPNGNEDVKVRGAFSGAQGGYIELI